MAKRSKIILKGLQVKSLDKARKLANALSVIEEECGIKEVELVFKDVFVCGWLDTSQLNTTEMELLIRDIMDDLRKHSEGI